MRIALAAAAILLALVAGAAGNLNAVDARYPRITSVAIDPEDPDRLLLHLSLALAEAALSTDGGESFVPLSSLTEVAGTDWSPTLSVGTRRYALVDAGRRRGPIGWGRQLMRSDDSGRTWNGTGAYRFLMEQGEQKASAVEQTYRELYGSRLPARSPRWHGAFAFFGAVYLATLGFLPLRQSWLWKAATSLRGLLILLMVWVVLVAFHGLIHHWLELHHPFDYDSPFTVGVPAPTARLGLAMGIAARPWTLLVYLLVLWPLLPGSREVLTRWLGENRPRAALAVTVGAAALFLISHVVLVFTGPLWGSPADLY